MYNCYKVTGKIFFKQSFKTESDVVKIAAHSNKKHQKKYRVDVVLGKMA